MKMLTANLKFDINLPDFTGTNPLGLAIRSGNIEMLCILLENGADPKALKAHNFKLLDEMPKPMRKEYTRMQRERQGSMQIKLPQLFNRRNEPKFPDREQFLEFIRHYSEKGSVSSLNNQSRDSLASGQSSGADAESDSSRRLKVNRKKGKRSSKMDDQMPQRQDEDDDEEVKIGDKDQRDCKSKDGKGS